jgi:hypothetical protein
VAIIDPLRNRAVASNVGTTRAALFAVLAFAILFGALGALLAAPLAVVSLVVINDLYVDEIDLARSGGCGGSPSAARGVSDDGCSRSSRAHRPYAHHRGLQSRREST